MSTEKTAAPPATKHARDVYFVSPLVDILIAGGGLSFLVYVAFLAVSHAVPGWTERKPVLITLAVAFSWFVNYPHFAATSMRLYQSFDRMMQFPKTSFLSPVLVGGGLVMALQNTEFAPWYVKLFLVWSGYHYSGQTKGISLIYARRMGIQIDPITRALIAFPIYASWLYLIIAGEARTGGVWSEFYAIKVPTGLPLLGSVPAALVSPLQTLSAVLWIAALGGFGLLLLWVMVRQGRMYPVAACAPICAQMLWYIPGLSLPTFAEFIPLFHSVQYFIIAWVFQVKEESGAPGYFPSVASVVWESLRWFAFVFVGGLLLFVVIPGALEMRLYPVGYAEPCFIAAVQIHHFFVDGVIWKIRDPKVRSNLAGNLFDLAGVPRTV